MSWRILLSWVITITICVPVFGNHAAHQPDIGAQHVRRSLNSENFTNDLMMTATTNAMQKATAPKMKIDDDKKTLSQQVADGKYGLIQKELFRKPSQRPGVLSYDSNSEVPKDNLDNLGGLNKSDIWLAENHLLVLRGGVYPVLEALPEYSRPVWQPIDDFDAPRRQVKLPKHPKVPPPFPVQLTDGGPLQIIGTNFTRTLNDSFFPPPYSVSPVEGYDPGSGPYFPPQYSNPSNATSGETPFPTSPFPPPIQGGNKPGDDGSPPQFPFPINGAVPPFFDSLPPGSAILPPPNITDQYDEDDLSIYYPPPYSFYYPKDNSTEVPPGPLVPGIVLPPPPDFFGVLGKSSAPTKPMSTTEATTPTRPRITTTTPPPTIVYATRKPPEIKNEVTSKPITTKIKPVYHPTTLPEFIDKTRQQVRNKSINVTVLRPVKPTRHPPPVYIYDNNVSNKPFAEYGPPPTRPRHRGKISITTMKVPLRAYFSTSKDTITNLVTSLPERIQYTTKNALKHRTRPTTQIYYYDDVSLTNSIPTPYPQNGFINFTKDYNTEVKDSRKYQNTYIPVQQPQTQPQYYYVPSKSYITQRPRGRIVQQAPYSPDNFKNHIEKLQEQIQSFQRPPKQYKTNLYEFHGQEPGIPSSKPVYQYSFEVANYQEQHDKLRVPEQQNHQFQNVPKYSVQIEPAVEITTTERPYYRNVPAPIYYQDNSQRSPPQKYYINNAPQYNYQQQQKYSSAAAAVTPHPEAFAVTPNPIYQPYYTKQDEQFLDDITKTYFTSFGKKISTSTTPIPKAAASPINSDQRQQMVYTTPERIRQPSYVASAPLKDNIVVNYVNQAPVQNIQPEYVQHQPQPYPQVAKQVPHFRQSFQQQVFPQNYRQNNKNYQQPSENYRKNIPQNVQTIQAISVSSEDVLRGKPGSFISYELPGDDGAHFYFLTPQLTRKDDHGDITYYYTQPAGSRIRRDA